MMEIDNDTETQVATSTGNKRVRFDGSPSTIETSSKKLSPSESALFTANITLVSLPDELKPLIASNFRTLMKLTKEGD